MVDADDGDLGDVRVLDEPDLDLGRVDVLTASDDEVLAPALEIDELVDDVAVVAGAVPPFVVQHRARGFGVLPVAEEERGHAYADLADLSLGQRRTCRRVTHL